MHPKIERPDPPYLQVARHIRRQITDGTLPDGELIPSTRQIARDWNISVATATKVLGVLQADGLVRAVPGIGTVVASQNVLRTTGADRIVTIRQSGRIYPEGEYAKILSAGIEPAPNYIADSLGLKPHADVIRRHRIRYRDEQPVSSSTSWFAADLAKEAPLLLQRERVLQGTSIYIEESTGRNMRTGHDQIAASTATDDAAAQLGIEPGSPVLISRHWTYDSNEHVIEYGETVALPDRWISYDYDATGRKPTTI